MKNVPPIILLSNMVLKLQWFETQQLFVTRSKIMELCVCKYIGVIPRTKIAYIVAIYSWMSTMTILNPVKNRDEKQILLT